jgi:hypothetical protein
VIEPAKCIFLFLGDLQRRRNILQKKLFGWILEVPKMIYLVLRRQSWGIMLRLMHDRVFYAIGNSYK